MIISPDDLYGKLQNREHLPSGLVVQGSVNLSYTNSTTLSLLPEKLTIKGTLDISHNIYLTHLPGGLVVEVNTILNSCINLTYLPEDLIAKGYLCLEGCNLLTNLPSNLMPPYLILCDKKLIDMIPEEDLPLYVNFNFVEYAYEHFTHRLRGKIKN